jgi:phytoene dehydrogenase-like protein
MPDVIVVGAGLAGLCCARELHASGLDVLVLERGDAPGGRVRTDEVDGFLLDRGFQVLLTAYPEARRVLDYERLGLRPFESGALIRRGERFTRIADPFRYPLKALESLRDAPGSILDKLRVARLRSRLSRFSLNEVLTAPQVTTAEALRREGFSPRLVDAFFRPFLGGIFLDPSLETSSRLFAFVFKLFSEGEAVLPAGGMQAIPRQLAESLPEAALRFGVTVESARPGEVVLAGGERLTASAVVVAADGPEAARLTGAIEAPAPRAVTTIHYAAERSPVGEPVLVLDGDAHGPVNDLCVPSDVAPSYAPPGAALVSATVLGIPPLSDKAIDGAVREQLRGWFGAQVDGWRLLRVLRIPFALPAQTPAVLASAERPVRLREGLFVCGDHRDTASSQGAMVSGRRAAAAVRGLDVGPACAL